MPTSQSFFKQIYRTAGILLVFSILTVNSIAAPKSGQTFENWTARCDTVKNSDTEQCFIFQNLVLKDSGQRVLHVAIGYLPQRPDPVALITLPLGIALPPGGSISIDEGEAIPFAIERCETQGCRAGVVLDDGLLQKFKKGLSASVTFHDGTRKPIAAPLSLKGFTAGLNALLKPSSVPSSD